MQMRAQFLSILVVCSFIRCAKQTFHENVQAIIAQMNETRFNSTIALDLLEEVISNVGSDIRTGQFEYTETYVRRGGINVLIYWLNQFELLNSVGNKSQVVMKYCARTLVVCFHGVWVPPFRLQMVSSGLLEALFRLVFTQSLFGNPVFTQESFKLGLRLAAEFDYYDRLAVRSPLRNVFGPDFLPIRNRFQREENDLSTLFLATILVKKESVIMESDAESFTIDPVLLWRIRDNLLFALNNDDENIYKFRLEAIDPYDIYYEHNIIIAHFSVFLLSSCNRINLCDKTTLNFYMAIIDGFVNRRPKYQSDNRYIIGALRAIFILMQTCSDFIPYVQKHVGKS